MTLTIDIGNTTTNCGLFDGEKIIISPHLSFDEFFKVKKDV